MPPASSSTDQRIASGPFISAVLGLYVLCFASQALLAGPVTLVFNVAPFVAAQALLIACWVVLHRRRMLDAGRPAGIVMGVAAVYALDIVLFATLMALMLAGSAGGVGPQAGILQLFVIIYLLSSLGGDASLGAAQFWIVGLIALLLLPLFLAVGFSVWAARQPTVR